MIDAIKIKNGLSPVEYAKLYFLFCIRICKLIDLRLESIEKVTINSFVKLQCNENWYYIGNDNSLDAIPINSESSKFELFLHKTVGETLLIEDRYGLKEGQKTEIIESIYSIEVYILFKIIYYFNELSKNGDLDGVQMIQMPQEGETIDTGYLLKYLGDLHSQSKPIFDLYCKSNSVPLALLAMYEGGITNAIGKIQREQKGFINFSDGSIEEFSNQKIIVEDILKNNKSFYIDAISSIFLCETGLILKIFNYLPGLKIPQSVINLLANISNKFSFTEDHVGNVGYSNGKIFFSKLEREKSDLIRSNFLKGIAAFESKPDNISVISDANRINIFFEIKFHAELCDSCSLSMFENIPILTDDPLFLKMVKLRIKTRSTIIL